MKPLNRLISHKQKELRKETCWCVSNITAGSPEQIQLVLDSGVIDKLIYMMQVDESSEVRQEGVWALANMTMNALPYQYVVFL